MKKGRSIRTIIITVGLLIFTVYTVISLVMINHSINTKKLQTMEMKEQTENTNTLNKELRELIENNIDTDYIIKMAREKLNLILPGEQVYEDISGN